MKRKWGKILSIALSICLMMFVPQAALLAWAASTDITEITQMDMQLASSDNSEDVEDLENLNTVSETMELYGVNDVIRTNSAIRTNSTITIWDGSTDTDWYNDGDTEFTITTAEQLAGFEELVNGGNNFSGKTVKLDADIVLNDVSDVENWDENTQDLNTWTAIGTASSVFSGTFDGDGHTVSGVYISSSKVEQGLFGYNTHAAVKNVGVTDSYIKGRNYVGGVVGVSYGGSTVENCYNRGTVVGIGYVGGVIGYSNCESAENCYNTGSVTGDSKVGGVVGYSFMSVKNCYNTGSVSGTGEYVGGVIGSNGKTLQNCYNTGSVTGSSSVGGVAGENSGTVTSCYYDKTTCGDIGGINGGDVTGQAEGKTTDWMKNATSTSGWDGDSDTFDGWDTSIWIFESDKYPYFRTSGGSSDEEAPTVGSVTPSGTGTSLEGSIAITFSEAMDTNTAGTVSLDNEVGSLDTGNWSESDTVYTVSYSGLAFETEYTISIFGFSDTSGNEMSADDSHTFTTGADSDSSEIWDGSSTDTDWYNENDMEFTISTPAQLAGLAVLVNGGNDFSDKTVTLDADIVLNDVSNAANWDDSTTGLNAWTPIGTVSGTAAEIESYPFKGTFDGDGHTVNGIYISTAYDEYQGMFGDVYNGTVKNVGVTDSYIKGANKIGGVVGSNGSDDVSDGMVENCYNADSVTISGRCDSVGGVVGMNSGTIRNCYNAGSVAVSEDYSNVGGVVGRNYGTIQNCYNMGSVIGGENNSNIGGVVGDNGSDTVTGCYYDKTICGNIGGINGNDTTGAVGKTTTEMKTAATFTDWDTSIWTFEEGEYPQLSIFASSGESSDEEAPTVGSVTPSGTGAGLEGSIAITFSEAMDTNTAGVVSLDNSVGALGAGAWSGENKVYTVSYSGLAANTEYTMTISGFQDAAGNAMTEDTSHTFTTGAAPVDVFDYSNEPETGVFHLRVNIPSDNTSFQLPVCRNMNEYSSEISYNWLVDWGDGNSEQAEGTSNNTPDVSHTYAGSGEYIISITPNGEADSGWFRAFGFSNYGGGADGDANKEMLTGFAGVFDDDSIDFDNTDYLLFNLFRRCTNLIAANIRISTDAASVGNSFADHMFANCESLESLPDGFSLPDGITTAGDSFAGSMFYDCKSLKSLPEGFNLPDGITTAGDSFADHMFSGCKSLELLPEGFSLPDGITTAGDSFVDRMFSGCESLELLPEGFNLPNGITTAGDSFVDGMFYDCKSLKSLPEGFNLPDGITTAGESFAAEMFADCKLLESLPDGFNLPGGITNAGEYFAMGMFYDCKSLESLPEGFNLPDGTTATGDVFAALMFSDCESLESLPEGFNLPGGITTAGDSFITGMFYNCESLESLPEEFNLPDGITTAGESFATQMFSNCTSLESLPEDFNLPGGITMTGESFASGIFSGCTKLKINSKFKFPALSQEQINQEGMFEDVFGNITAEQDRGAAARILSNLPDSEDAGLTKIYPGSDRNTFSEAFKNDASWNAIHANWKAADSTYTLPMAVTEVAADSGHSTGTAAGLITITFSKPLDTETTGTVTLHDASAGSDTTDDLTLTPFSGTDDRWKKNESGEYVKYVIAYNGLEYEKTYSVRISGFESANGEEMDAVSDDTYTFTTKADDSVLTGTAAITGDAVYGKELTATLKDGNSTGTLSYQWTRDGENITGATGGKYTLTADDIGAEIAVIITSSDKKGTRTSAPTDEIAKADYEGSVLKPIVLERTDSSITLAAVEGYEYGISFIPPGGDLYILKWQDSNIFTGLTAGKEYDFCQRIKETDTHNASEKSAQVTVETKLMVTYNWNYDGASEPYATHVVSAGDKATAPAAPQRAGYTFEGWYKESVCTNVWEFNSDTVSTSVTLFAKWKLKDTSFLEVSYTKGGATSGRVPSDSAHYKSGDTVTVSGNTGSLSKSGASFAGWSDGMTTYAAGDTFTITDNTVLTAVWTENAAQYTVTYSNNYTGGGNDTTQAVEYGALQSKPAVPTRAGYTFVGWYKSAGCIMPWNFELDTVTGDTTLYAKWVQETYSVSGTVQDDAAPSPDKVEGAAVKVMQGNVQFGSTVLTDAEGKFIVTGIPNGEYNIVIAKEGHTVTLHIRVDGSDFTYEGQITLPGGNKNSKLDIIGADTPNIVENGLHDLFDDSDIYDENSENAVTNGGTVEIRLAVQKDDSSQEKETVTAQMSSAGYKAGVVLNIGIEKTVTSNSGAILDQSSITALDDTLTLIIPLPEALQGKSNYVVYRTHDYGGATGVKVDKIKTSKNADNEYIEVSADKTYLTLHAKFFSTYAIGYTESSGGSSTRGSSSRTRSYTITASVGDGGSISPSGSVRVDRSSSKTFAITAKDGYAISDVLVDGESVGAVTSYTFKKVNSAHTISVVFTKAEGLPYYLSSKGSKVFIGFASSVSGTMKYIAPEGETILFVENPKEFIDIADHWAKSYIDFVTQREIFVGTGMDTFSPNAGMTRSMFATVIGRLYERSYGKLVTSGTHSFRDCDYEGWYGPCVDWCSENGIIEGIGGDQYAPDREITRQEMAGILYRFAQFLGDSGVSENTALNYSDSREIDSWAKEAALYCQQNGIISGRNDDSFAPNETATRAETSAILERFIEFTLE